MRDLQNDLEWLIKSQNSRDLTDEWLKENGNSTREEYQNYAPEWLYGITWVESTIAGEWLQRAIIAESKLVKE